MFGIERIDSFRGSYAIPSTVIISARDPPRAELTVKGQAIAPVAPSVQLQFDLLAPGYSKRRWTLAGPAGDSREAYVLAERIVLGDSGGTGYRLNRDELEVVDIATRQSAIAPLPNNFPRFSWPMDIAYDSKRKLVSVVTLGGEGFLYRFSTEQKRWLDYRSLNNVDIFSISYDREADGYVAWTGGNSLFFLSGEGDPLFARNVAPVLQELGRPYAQGHIANAGLLFGQGHIAMPPRLIIAANKDDIALVRVSESRVAKIWHYNLRTEQTVLTFSDPSVK